MTTKKKVTKKKVAKKKDAMKGCSLKELASTVEQLIDSNNNIVQTVSELASEQKDHKNVLHNLRIDSLSPPKTSHVYTSKEIDIHHLVVHNLGQEKCHVTVSEDRTVIIPQKILYADENMLIVTFNSYINCDIVVSK